MKSFIEDLSKRNPQLAIFGFLNLAAAVIMMVLMQFDHQQILGSTAGSSP